MITLEEWEANCKSHEHKKVYLVYVDYFGDENIHIADFPVEFCRFAIDFLGKGHLLILYGGRPEAGSLGPSSREELDDIFFSKEEAEKHATFDNYPYRLKKEEK